MYILHRNTGLKQKKFADTRYVCIHRVNLNKYLDQAFQLYKVDQKKLKFYKIGFLVFILIKSSKFNMFCGT